MSPSAKEFRLAFSALQLLLLRPRRAVSDSRWQGIDRSAMNAAIFREEIAEAEQAEAEGRRSKSAEIFDRHAKEAVFLVPERINHVRSRSKIGGCPNLPMAWTGRKSETADCVFLPRFIWTNFRAMPLLMHCRGLACCFSFWTCRTAATCLTARSFTLRKRGRPRRHRIGGWCRCHVA